jgi:LysR family glycine cleavage system transcriptional activator
LESQLGVDMFVRANRSLRLTPAGKIFTETARDALATLESAAKRARQIQTRAQLWISTSTSIAAKWLVPRLHQFAKLEPNADVRIDVTCAAPSLDRDDVDIAICYGYGSAAGLHADRLFDHVIFPVCSPALLQSKSPLRSPADLLRHTLIHVTWSGLGVTWPDWQMWMHAAGVERFERGPGLHFEDSAFAIQAAIRGDGIALGDISLVADDLAAGRLVQPFALAIDGPPKFAYFMVSRVEPADNSLVSRFREWALCEAQKTRDELRSQGSSYNASAAVPSRSMT